ncbi:MAG: hypothetical protein AAF226_09835, partial [Verrucomicrobiota bacterium]
MSWSRFFIYLSLACSSWLGCFAEEVKFLQVSEALSKKQGWGEAQQDKSVTGYTLSIANATY